MKQGLAWVILDLVLLVSRSFAAPPAQPVVLDDFESTSAWSAVPASGVTMKLASEPGPHGNALRVDFDFHGGGGYAVLHRKLDVDLPANYRIEYQLRGATSPQNLELKLIDDSGDNVWWCNRVSFEYPRAWTLERVRKRQISYAWGPKGGGELRHVAALEFAITAGSGGRGVVWFDELRLVPLPVAVAPPPVVAMASSFARGHEAASAADTLASTWWESLSGDREPTLTLDLGTSREFGGLVVDWQPRKHASGYDVEFDDGDGRWRVVREVRSSDGGRDWLDLPESETRRVRLHMRAKPATTVAVAGVHVMPLEWAATPERFLMAVAKDSPRGHYPRALLDEQVYWTVVGADMDPDEGLLDEDGRLETGRGKFSLEPFLMTERGLRTWADGRTEQSLEQGSLPMPTATRYVDSLALSVSVFARRPNNEAADAALVARYRVRDLAMRPRRVTLFLALRPFQVNPPSQSLNLRGGPAPIGLLVHDERGTWLRADPEPIGWLRSNGRWSGLDGFRLLATRPAPDRFSAMTFDEGDFVAALAAGSTPARDTLADPTARASAALRWKLEIPSGGEREVDASIGISQGGTAMWGLPEGSASTTIASFQDSVARDWDTRLGTFEFDAGGSGHEVAATLRAQLGYVLVNRDKFGIQPGSRSYERSWIRDGSLTSSALLHAGMPLPVMEFLEWYADHQYPDGKVPCCVDHRGSDPVPENDSHGEFVFLAAEYLRLTGDRATVERVYPHVRAAVAYMDTLRAQRRTPEWHTKSNAAFYGLLPPSISHEGYSAKPMHSYWDDLFALRGYRDGVWLAQQLGKQADARWMAKSRDEFAREFRAAATAAMAAHAIDFIPGCSDLGDFDATSTTIALSPVQAEGVLPQAALRTTFERYWEFFVKRRDGVETWDAFTPYEMRNIGAFVRLGWRARANELLDWFMQFRRPAGWKQWAEVVDHDPRHARFIGDMPHTWVGTDFVRSVQDMLAYERERDSTLVLCAGIPSTWVEKGGVTVKGLQTRWGTVSYVLRNDHGHLLLTLDASALRPPPGGIEFVPPVEMAPPGTVEGVPAVRIGGKLFAADPADGRVLWRPTRKIPKPPFQIAWGYRLPSTPQNAPIY